MKRILLPLIALLLSVGVADAQRVSILNAKKAAAGLARNSSGVPAERPNGNVAKAPARIALADNQQILGGYTTDEYASAAKGIGLPKYPGTLGVASMLSTASNKRFDGGKVVAIRYALAVKATVKSVFLYTVNTQGEVSKTFEQEVTGESAAGWNMVSLVSPYTLDFTGVEGLLLGFTYVQSNANNGQYYNDECYPLSITGTPSTTYVYGNLGSGTGWYSMGSDYGSLSVQAVVEKEYASDDLCLSDISNDLYNKSGSSFAYSFTLTNNGSAVPSSYVLNVAVDGKTVKTLDTPVALSATSRSVTVKDEIVLGSDVVFGKHKLSVSVDKINGVTPTENAADDEVSTSFYVYNNTLPRQKHLVEHFTSNSCTFCPLGDELLKALAGLRDDIARVSVHGVMNASVVDPYNNDDCDLIMINLDVSGFPGASFNRTCFDLGTGEGVSLVKSLGYDASYRDRVASILSDQLDNMSKNIPTFASIAVDATHDVASNKLVVKVTGDGADGAASLLGEGMATLSVYVVEDSLVSKQLNSGTWVYKYEHNCVLRQSVSSVYGDSINWNGATYENDYSIDWNPEWTAGNMRVVAFISRPLASRSDAEKMVFNTEMASVKEEFDPTGISAAASSAGAVSEVARYTADGVQLKSPAKGLNIVKLSDGRTIKVVVK